MTIRVATANQSHALSRSLAGSLGLRKDQGDATFDGVLSNVADDQAAGAPPPGTTPDKDDAGPGTPQNGASSLASGAAAAATRDAVSPADPSVLASRTLVGKPGANWAAAIGTSTNARTKTRHANDGKADQADRVPAPTQGDPSATAPAGSPQLSLLALVQSAAAFAPPDPTARPVADPASTGATAPVPSNGISLLVGDPKSASTAPLVSDVAFQTYLAPVSTPRTVSTPPVSTPPVLQRGGAGDTSPVIPAQAPQLDLSVGIAVGALVAPLARAVGRQTAGASNAVAAPPADGMNEGGSVIAQSQPGAPLRQGPILPGDVVRLGRDPKDTPDDRTPTANRPTTPASAGVAGSEPASRDATSLDLPASSAASPAPVSSASASSAPSPKPMSPAPASGPVSTGQPSPDASRAVAAPVLDAAIGLPTGGILPTPLQPVADAITSLASQPAGPVQALDPAARLSPARTMLLQLNPGDLGTVSVRLHLTGRSLDVSLVASQDQTAALLDHGRDALTRAIGDQDYQVNSLVIQRGDPQRGDAASPSGTSNATSTDYSRDQAASQGGGDATGRNGGQGGDGSPARQDRSDRQAQPRPAPAARGSGLFL